MNKKTYDLIVVGGGAAGMLASAVAAERGLDTLLVEKNARFGRKLGITGKGRCNLTNDTTPKDVIDHIPTGGRFLYSAVSAFPPESVKEAFSSMGVPLKTERGRRVFPVSDRAADVVSALERRMKRAGTQLLRANVTSVICEDGICRGVNTEAGPIRAPRVLLCTGGASYPATGSDGSGYRIAEKLGHTVIAPAPSLVPLVAAGEDCAEMQGLSLRNVTLTVTDGSRRPVFQEFGELLFTHYGLSGPLILSASAHMRDFRSKRYVCHIDLKPALDESTLDARILRDFSENPNRDFVNVLPSLVNRLMVPVIVRRSGIPAHAKVNSVTKMQRRALVSLLKDLSFEIEGPRPIEEAIVTSGGVDTREIDPKTMESKLVGGLYFAGEIINCDGYTGGFNLQIAWSTAYAAAVHMEPEEI